MLVHSFGILILKFYGFAENFSWYGKGTFDVAWVKSRAACLNVY